MEWSDSTIRSWYKINIQISSKIQKIIIIHSYVIQRQIYVHTPFDVLNIAKVKFLAMVSQEYVCSANEVLADENFQR